MIRILSSISLVVLLLGTSVVQAENPQTGDSRQLAEILSSLKSLQTDLDFFKSVDLNKRLKDIEDRLSRLDGAGLIPTPVPGNGKQVSNFAPLEADRRMADLVMDLRALEERVRRLEERSPNGGNDNIRIQRSIAIPSSIRLRNTSGLPATVYINGFGYDLNPFEVRTLPNQRAGVFNYEVQVDGYGVVRPLTARTLGEGEIYAITIYPPR